MHLEMIMIMMKKNKNKMIRSTGFGQEAEIEFGLQKIGPKSL
jgi:hypothetical protein